MLLGTGLGTVDYDQYICFIDNCMPDQFAPGEWQTQEKLLHRGKWVGCSMHFTSLACSSLHYYDYYDRPD